MALVYSSTATATVAANTNSINISGMDISAVLSGMVINLGARDRVTGDGYIVSMVAPNGASGGTITTVGSIPVAFNNAAFVIDTRDFNGTAPNYLIATYTQVLNALLRLTSPLTNLFTGSRQLALDKESSGAVSRLLYAIGGRTWGALEQRAVSYTPTGGAQVTTETVALRAYPDGTTPVDVLMVDLATGAGDLRKASATMIAASTTDLGSAPVGKVALTGSGTVVSFGVGRHLERLVHVVDGGATLTHNASSLVLPGGGNIITAAGDCFHATSDGSGNWRVRSYTRVSGKALTLPAAGDISGISGAGLAVLTGSAAQGASALGVGPSSSPLFADIRTTGNATIGSGAGSSSRHIGLSQAAGNSINLDVNFRRHTAGSDWSGTQARIQRYVDQSLHAFLDFGIDGIAGSFGLGFGMGSITHMVMDNNGSIGIGAGNKSPQYKLDVLGTFRASGNASFGAAVALATYIVSTMPAGVFGGMIHVSNGRKIGEGAGSGTGVIAYYSNNNWRRLSDDSPVAA